MLSKLFIQIEIEKSAFAVTLITIVGFGIIIHTFSMYHRAVASVISTNVL